MKHLALCTYFIVFFVRICSVIVVVFSV